MSELKDELIERSGGHGGSLSDISRSMRPKVSVMIITYNHGPYIAQAIDSVLMQETNFDFTINVIEDCSTDDTADIVRAYAAKYPGRVIPFLNKKNIGYAVTQRNFVRGFRTLNGEYLAILEGDDYWTSPHKLQRQVDFLDRNPDYAICAHNTIKTFEDGSQEPHRFLYYGKQADGTIDDAISLRLFFHTTGVLYRNVFNGVPPRQYISKWSCDIFILISHAAHGKIHHIDEDMAVYRAHAGGRFSTMKTVEGWKFNIGGLQRYNAWLGFRFMKPFAKMIARYCDVILNETGSNGIESLSVFERVKYNLIKYLYLSIYRIFDIPNYFSRLLLLASLQAMRVLERRRIDSTPIHEISDRWAPLVALSRDSADTSASVFGRKRSLVAAPIVTLALSVIRRVLRGKLSDERLPPITLFGPQPVEHGKLFNVQPDGLSAIWMRTECAPPARTTLVFGGTAVPTFVEGDIVTASLPSHLTAKPALIPIWLEVNDESGMRISNPVYFETK